MGRAETFQLGRASMRVREYGKTGRPVVLIHGLSGSARWWKYNVPALSKRYRVLVVELSGYGSLTAWRQRSLGVREDAALLAAWLRARDLHGVTLVGHSMGGHIAMYVAAQCPDRVCQLALVCASGLLASHPARVALQVPRAALVGRWSFLSTVVADSARAGIPNLWRSARVLLSDSVRDLLPALGGRPTLVVWGGRDPLVPAALGRQLAGAIPGARYVEITEAGHNVMVDAPAEFNRAVLEFLDHVPLAGGPGRAGGKEEKAEAEEAVGEGAGHLDPAGPQTAPSPGSAS